MNGKLIAMLIRSNALMIEAIGEVTRQLDKSGNYSENHFWNLRSEVIAMAEEAEAILESTITIESDECLMRNPQDIIQSIQSILDNYPNNSTPIIPISPAHQPKKKPEPLFLSDILQGRKFIGKFEKNENTYLARIEDVDLHWSGEARDQNIKTIVLAITDVSVIPHERSIPQVQFQKEFIRWEK